MYFRPESMFRQFISDISYQTPKCRWIMLCRQISLKSSCSAVICVPTCSLTCLHAMHDFKWMMCKWLRSVEDDRDWAALTDGLRCFVLSEGVACDENNSRSSAEVGCNLYWSLKDKRWRQEEMKQIHIWVVFNSLSVWSSWQLVQGEACVNVMILRSPLHLLYSSNISSCH